MRFPLRASDVGKTLGVPVDGVGRVQVRADLTVPDHSEVFVIGDMSHATDASGRPLPGVALVAMQQGIYVAQTLKAELKGKARSPCR